MHLTGKAVLQAFKSDVEGFFKSDSGFVMNTAVSGTRTRYMGNAEKGGIAISEDLANFEIDSLEKLMLVLLVLGHETAHLLNVHGGHKDESNDDTRALEVWADFYGTKVALTVMTIGDRLQDIVSSMPGGGETATRLDAVGEAIGLLATSYFDTNDGRYEPAPVRVSTCVAGVMSFLDTFWSLNGIARNVQRSISLQLRLYQSPSMKAQLVTAGESVPDRAQLPMIHRIHQAIQGDRPAITKGMKPIPAAWLSTTYEGTEEERLSTAKAAIEKLNEELSKLGLKLP